MHGSDTKQYISKIGVYLVILICSIISTVMILNSVSNRLEKSRTTISNYITEENADNILNCLEYNIDIGNLESKLHATYITNDILQNYNDNKILKSDLQNIYNTDIINIIKRNIDNYHFRNVNNHDNEIIIADCNGIIYDRNYSISNGKILRTWEEELKNYNNSNLYTNSIKYILNQETSKFICTCTDPNSELNSYNNITKNDIKQIVLEGNIEKLKNLVFYCVSYIYDDSDILGTPDICNGIKVENYKLIVIQKFNFYDQLINNDSEILDNTEDDKIAFILNDMGKYYKLLVVLLIIDFIITIVISCLIYNFTMDFIEKNNINDN